jgi:hypothetical protein
LGPDWGFAFNFFRVFVLCKFFFFFFPVGAEVVDGYSRVARWERESHADGAKPRPERKPDGG